MSQEGIIESKIIRMRFVLFHFVLYLPLLQSHLLTKPEGWVEHGVGTMGCQGGQRVAQVCLRSVRAAVNSPDLIGLLRPKSENSGAVLVAVLNKLLA